MIQPQELRIGNYYQGASRGNIETVTWQTLRDLSEGKLNLLPIPLTEEILIKAGFEKDLHCGYESVYHHKNFDLCIYNKIGTLGFELHEVEGFTINHEPFFNLHQLQNLYFALTNKELIFKN